MHQWPHKQKNLSEQQTIRFGQTEEEEPHKGPKPEQKGPNRVDTGAKRKTSKPEGREVNLRVRPRG